MGAGADLAKAVGFGGVFAGDDSFAHDQFLPRISRSILCVIRVIRGNASPIFICVQ
jgi:hypothetical protein